MKKNYSIVIALVIFTILLAFGCKGSGSASVPASWDGDYALVDAPEMKVLTVHDGKIFAVAADTESEQFPATYPQSGYKVKSSDAEVSAEYGEAYVKFSLDGDNLTMETTGGNKVEYVKMESEDDAEAEVE